MMKYRIPINDIVKIQLKEYDIIEIIPGEYYLQETLVLNIPDHVTITSEDVVVINGCNLPYGNNGIEINGNNLSISNLKIIYAGFKGILFQVNNSSINNIEAAYNCDSGILISGGNNIIQNCRSHHNFGYYCTYKGELKPGFSSDGFSDKLHSNAANIYINCISWKNGDDGFDFYERLCSGTKLVNCLSFLNGLPYVDLSLNLRSDLPKTDLKHVKSFGGGSGFKLGGNNFEHDIILEECSAIYNMDSGFGKNNNSGEIKLKNCQSFNNGNWNYSFPNGKILKVVLENCSSNLKVIISPHSGKYKDCQFEVTINKELKDEIFKFQA